MTGCASVWVVITLRSVSLTCRLIHITDYKKANAILYHAIHRTTQLAEALKDTSEVPSWQARAAQIKTAANDLLWDAEQGMYRDNETSALAPQDGNVWAVLSNLTQTPAQIESISSHLAARWTPFGAPAPEAGDAVCPFISGLELQTHMAAGNTNHAVALMRRMWGYMLDGPGMTNSTFIEGYATDGSPHYQPYTNDPKVSHAHGWASGPTSFLTFYIAGVRLVGPAGKTWRIEPNIGDLKIVEAGFSTIIGDFSVRVERGDGVRYMDMSFETPAASKGSLSLEHPGCEGRIEARRVGRMWSSAKVIRRRIDKPGRENERICLDDLQGGKWDVSVLCDEGV